MKKKIGVLIAVVGLFMVAGAAGAIDAGSVGIVAGVIAGVAGWGMVACGAYIAVTSPAKSRTVKYRGASRKRRIDRYKAM